VQRIYQDLVAEHQFAGSYHSVRRFVLRLQPAGAELPFRRMECAPGEELQIDFGQGAWIVEEGKRRKSHLLRCVLGYSRKGYSEAVWRQDTETFLRAIENAFRYFGGVTATVVIDNLKAGVIRADSYDPDLNPKLEEFARHYGTVILPCKPGMARHKGKVEAGVRNTSLPAGR
jgi:transposase